MDAVIRLFADAVNAKTKLDNGFDVIDFDKRVLKIYYSCRYNLDSDHAR